MEDGIIRMRTSIREEHLQSTNLLLSIAEIAYEKHLALTVHTRIP